MKLSEKMHTAGWSITQKKNGDFCVYAANGITYTYSKTYDTWSEPVENNYKIIKKYSDGYLIKTGFNTTFRKGYSKDEFLNEIKMILGGNPSLITMFYSNPFVKWMKTSD